jgi:NAD+ diphosphatase
MIACVADADGTDLTIDYTELEDALWASKEDVRAALDGDEGRPFNAPPPFAIAHTLMRRWAQED